jgi:hypothetical protein
MSTSRNALVYYISVIIFVLIILLSQNYYQATLAQLEIPEAKPVENNEFNVANTSNTSDVLSFEDSALGYSISYPNDWSVVEPNVEYGLSGFTSPDGSASVTVKLVPALDRTLKDFGDDFKDSDFMQLSEFYRNSSTTLGGLPGLIVTGIFTYSPNVFQQATGESGYTNRVYQVWGLSEERDGFYGVLFGADSKLSYDEYLPDAEQMIESFTVGKTGPVIQEDIEDVQEESDEEPDDTFVGSAGNNDENNEEQEND